MPRVFANDGHLKYKDWEPELGDHTLIVNGIYFQEYWRNNMIHCQKNDIVCHHLGHALGPEHEKNKIRWFMSYEHPELESTIGNEELNKRTSQSTYFDPRFWEHGQNADPVGIRKCEIPLPEILKSHPLYNKRIIND